MTLTNQIPYTTIHRRIKHVIEGIRLHEQVRHLLQIKVKLCLSAGAFISNNEIYEREHELDNGGCDVSPVTTVQQ